MTQVWHFPTTDGGDGDGISDAALETFEGDRERYIARECIQNSLDARYDYSQPVRVEFRKFTLPTSSVPGISELKDIFARARDFSNNQDRSKQFYDTAISSLERKKIDILKISDYNTTGLMGSDDDTSGGWYRLVRATGVSSMTGDGGGSFGIGKGAPFAFSALHTVYYSTFNVDGGVAFQGKTRISSFRDDTNDIRRGVGQFGEKNPAGRGVCAVRDLNGIPEVFQRQKHGTDVFVIGCKVANDEWSKAILRSVLDSFWMAIHNGILTVDVIDNDEILYSITSDNVGDLINEFASDDEYTRLFYRAVVDPTEKFEADLPLLGKVELYVKLGEGPKHIQGMRRSLMKIHTISRLRVMPDDFVGVFVARDEAGNKNLRNLEPPAHDKWDEKRAGDNMASYEAFKNARSWIIDSLRDLASKRTGILEEIPDLSRYLPEDIERDDLDETPSSSGQNIGAEKNRETADVVTAQGHEEQTPARSTITNRAPIIKPATASDNETKQKKVGSHKGKGNGGHGRSEPDDQGNKKYIDTTDMEVRTIESRLNGKRVYTISIMPNKDDDGILRLAAHADDGAYNLDIARVTDANGKTYEVKNGQIEGLQLSQGCKMKLVVELKSNRRYALGVA